MSGQSVSKGGKTSTGSWKGRAVSATPLLHGKLKASQTVDGKNVAQELGKKYGDYVASHFNDDLKNKKLAQRDINQLEGEASGLLRDIKGQNKQLINQLLDSGLAQEAFEYEFEYDWESLCQEERQHFIEQLRLSLSEAVAYLDSETIKEVVLAMTTNHQWLYSDQMGETSEYLLKQLPDETTVLPGYLRLWAEGHHDPEATPGEPLTSGVFKGQAALSERDVILLANTDHFSRTSARLLSSSPQEKLEVQSYEEQIEDTRNQARSIIKLLHHLASPSHHIPDELNRAIKSDLINQLDKVVALINELELDMAEDPLGERGWETFKENEVTIALKLLDAVYVETREEASAEKLSTLQQLKTEYQQHLKNHQGWR